MPFLKVPPEVSKALGGFLRGDRELVVKVLPMLREQLENNYEKHRGRRDPEDPSLFDYYIRVLDVDNKWHTLRFSVDDSTAAGYLLIAAVSDKPGNFLS